MNQSIGIFRHRPQLGLAMAVIAGVVAQSAIAHAANPPIRISAASKVPACVTPDRLMRFLATRNANLDPRFKDIARFYKQHGEAWKVRWDYAFYQMAIETNFLTYRAPGGRMGDVDPRQNNFAGIGTTGGGVPGDRYPDVSTGVLAQVQHLVVYSGERIDKPVAPRTQLKQEDILALSAPIARTRAVTFQDLSGRWAVDKAYGRSIQWVADRFVSQFCPRGEQAAVDVDDGRTNSVQGAVAAVQTGIAGPPAAGDMAGDAAAATGGRMGLAGNQPKLDSKRRSQAFAEAGGKSALAGPHKAKARPKADDEDIGIGIAKTAAPLPEGPGAEIARNAIREQRSTAGFQRSNVGGWAVPAIGEVGMDVAAPGAGMVPPDCHVYSASYGGTRTVVVKSIESGHVRFTLLTVLDGFERSLTEGFLKSQSPGATSIGVFDTRDEALSRVDTECGSKRPG